MDEDLSALTRPLEALLAGIEPARRRKALRAIATELRRSQADRIAAQTNPDGTRFEPRKARSSNHHRSVRERAEGRQGRSVAGRAMFMKLRTNRFLQAKSDANQAEVGFFDARTARIARVHQEGLVDKVDAKRSTVEVRYAVRAMIGLASGDRARILDRLVAMIG